MKQSYSLVKLVHDVKNSDCVNALFVVKELIRPAIINAVIITEAVK